MYRLSTAYCAGCHSVGLLLTLGMLVRGGYHRGSPAASAPRKLATLSGEAGRVRMPSHCPFSICFGAFFKRDLALPILAEFGSHSLSFHRQAHAVYFQCCESCAL